MAVADGANLWCHLPSAICPDSLLFRLYVFVLYLAVIIHIFFIFEVFIIIGHFELVVLALWH